MSDLQTKKDQIQDLVQKIDKLIMKQYHKQNWIMYDHLNCRLYRFAMDHFFDDGVTLNTFRYVYLSNEMGQEFTQRISYQFYKLLYSVRQIYITNPDAYRSYILDKLLKIDYNETTRVEYEKFTSELEKDFDEMLSQDNYTLPCGEPIYCVYINSIY